MMKISYVAVGIIMLMQISCSTNKVATKDLKELYKGEEKKCEYVKKITINSQSGDERAATLEFKKQVIEADADSYLLDEVVNNGKETKVIGSAFSCTKK